jgi:alkylation response protein AidB-like acyl-CoA dehydrogenase
MLPSLETLFGVNVRDAPLLCIGEGTNELQKIIISRQLIKRHPV